MFCPKCGTQLNDGTAFCEKCGANLKTGKVKSSGASLLTGKSVSWKDSDFVFTVLAAILAVISTILMHCPVISVGIKGMGASFSTQCTLLEAGKMEMDKITNAVAQAMNGSEKISIGSQAVGQIIFTVLVFAAIAFLFLPYVKKLNFKMNVLNYAVPAAILLFQLIFFIIALATNPMGELYSDIKPMLAEAPVKLSLGLSLDGWLVYICNICSIGILAWQLVKTQIKK